MDSIGERYFSIPAHRKKLDHLIVAVSMLKDGEHLFDHFRSQTKVLRKYDPELEYSPDGQIK